MDDSETLVQCPYNKAHSIIKSRMQFHLTKCSAQYANSEKVTCPYNSTHVINRVELLVHKQICPNRIALDSFLYSMGDLRRPKGVIPVSNNIDVPITEESWDKNPLEDSVLDVVKNMVQDKGVLLNLIGAPKAERRAHRYQERIRYMKVLDELQEKNTGKGNNRLQSQIQSITVQPNSRSPLDCNSNKLSSRNPDNQVPKMKSENGTLQLSNGLRKFPTGEESPFLPHTTQEASWSPSNTLPLPKELAKKIRNSLVKIPWNLPSENKETVMQNLKTGDFPELGSVFPKDRYKLTENNNNKQNHGTKCNNEVKVKPAAWTRLTHGMIVDRPPSIPSSSTKYESENQIPCAKMAWNVPAEVKGIEGKMQRLMIGDFPELGSVPPKNRHNNTNIAQSKGVTSNSGGENELFKTTLASSEHPASNPWGKHNKILSDQRNFNTAVQKCFQN